jgi:hypothetical protein
MNLVSWSDFLIRRLGVALLLLPGMVLIGCSSVPEPQPEPSKQEVQHDADRFFEKMGKEEAKPAKP